MNSEYVLSLFVHATLLLVGSAFAQEVIAPLPPERPPEISGVYECDRDGDRVDDLLEGLSGPNTTHDRSSLFVFGQDQSPALVPVQLIFSEPVTQAQIDDFLALGGEIDYVYKTVSYGWNGRITPRLVNVLPDILGDTLVLIKGPRQARVCMDVATQTGRVRPIWAAGFANRLLGGFDGDPSITIGIIDSGVDEHHPDLAGRRVYWRDFSNSREPVPVDYGQHGSFVAAVALGTGQAGGSGQQTLYYTTSGGQWGKPIRLSTSSYFTANATWAGARAWLALLGWPQEETFWDALDDGSLAAVLETAGYSPLHLSDTVSGQSDRLYLPYIESSTPGSLLQNIVMWCSVGSYPGSSDGFNRFRGVAPACKWAGAKVSDSITGNGYVHWIAAAVDDLATKRQAHDIKVINLSVSCLDGETNTELRDEVNSAVGVGIVVVAGAGNGADDYDDGPDAWKREIPDPGRAAMALTVVATNDNNRLTDYSSYGFANPRSSTSRQDFKPDVAAPGGSDYHTGILSVDSGSGDGPGQNDRQANDYTTKSGTSFSSPFAAGAAALVIDAMQQQGITWDFSSDRHSRYVKMLLCATATETNAKREDGRFNPSLQRADSGPEGWSAGKDRYEGYGIINPDAAVEAVCLDYSWDTQVRETLGNLPHERRAWARRAQLSPDCTYDITLTNPSTGDFDLYLYDAEPSDVGTPVIKAFSTRPGTGVGESVRCSWTAGQGGIDWPSGTPLKGMRVILAVKRISGSGQFTLSATRQATPEPPGQTASIVGTWTLWYRWEGGNSGGPSTTITFDPDGTFSTGEGSTGTWSQSGDEVSWTFASGTRYTGTFDSPTAMSGTMGTAGTWNAVRQ